MSDDTPLSPKQRRRIGFFGVAFGSLFLLVGIFVIFLGLRNGFRQMGTSHWEAKPGTLIKKDLNSWTEDRKPLSPISYKYVINNAEYFSDRVIYADMNNVDRSDWIALANGFPADGSITVYVNPDNPQESVLRNGSHSLSWHGVGFGSIFAGFALFWMIMWWVMSNTLPKILENRSASQ